MAQDNNEKSALPEDAKAKLAAAMGASTHANTTKTSNTAENDDAYASVVRIIDAATGLQEDELPREARIHDDLNIDSLSLLDITVRLEEKFGVRVSESDLHEANTVGDIVNLVTAND